MRPKPKEGATDYALIWVGQRGDLAQGTQASAANYGEGSGEERPRAVRQPTYTDLTALFGASAASREPAVALATARVTILVCVVIFLHFLDICSCGSCVGL